MFRLVFIACVVSFLAGAEPACAQGRHGPEWGDPRPLDRLLPQIRSHHPGTFYDAEGPYPDENGNPHYRLKWVTPEGRVIWLDTDAHTGRVNGIEHGANRGGYFGGPPRENFPPEGARHFGGGPGGPYARGPRDGGFGAPWGGHGGGDWGGRRGGGGWGGGHGGHHGHGG
jgi:hypothetical protein